MNMRTRLKRGALGALVALLVFGAGAFADDPGPTGSTTVSVAVVNGSREVALTGVDTGAPVPGTVPTLAFNATSTSSPFGVVVADLAHSRIGYSVSATLSNLHPVAGTTYDCSDLTRRVDAGDLQVTFPSMSVQPTQDIEASLQPTLAFADDIADDLSGVLGLDATDLSNLGITDTNLTVEDIVGTLQSWATNLALMNPEDGAGGGFAVAAAHPTCNTGDDANATAVPLQLGRLNDPGTALRDEIFATVAALDSTSTSISSTDAVTQTTDGNHLLPTDATSVGGVLYEATEEALIQFLADNGISVTSAELASLTASVVEDLTADLTDLALSLLGQSGIYANVPTLGLTAQGVTDVSNLPNGLYSGRMTVTLVDENPS